MAASGLYIVADVECGFKRPRYRGADPVRGEFENFSIFLEEKMARLGKKSVMQAFPSASRKDVFVRLNASIVNELE